MAVNMRIRRSTGTGFDILHPETTLNQIIGLMGADEKIKTGLLPSYIFGGMKFISVLGMKQDGSVTYTTTELRDMIDDWYQGESGDGPDTKYRGKYFVSIGNTITVSANDGFQYGDDGDGPGPTINVEEGDWVVCLGLNPNADGLLWGVVNNTYRDARENEKGVIQLATKSEAEARTNDTKAMTPLKTMQLLDEAPLKSANLTGTIADDRLSSNVALGNKSNYFISDQEFRENLKISKGEDSGSATIDLGNITTHTVTLSLPRNSGTIARIEDIDGLQENTSQTNNTVLAAPNGVNGIPTFRSLVPNDIPELAQSKITGLETALNNRSLVGHGHAISDVSGLTNALADLVPKTRTINGKSLTTNISITKSDVGLGSVQNFGIADVTQARSGTSNSLYMTPARTKDAINQLSNIPLRSSVPTDMSTYPEGKVIFEII